MVAPSVAQVTVTLVCTTNFPPSGVNVGVATFVWPSEGGKSETSESQLTLSNIAVRDFI
jgi:hypothetical protein